MFLSREISQKDTKIRRKMCGYHDMAMFLLL